MNVSRWIMVIVAGLSLTGAVHADAAQMARRCDVTRNGTVTSVDATRVLKFVAGMWHFTPEQQLLADASGNGKITAYDASLIMQAADGMDPPGCVCGELIQMP